MYAGTSNSEGGEGGSITTSCTLSSIEEIEEGSILPFASKLSLGMADRNWHQNVPLNLLI